MKNSLIAILVIIVITTLYLLSPWSRAPIARLLQGRQASACLSMPMPALYEEGEELLKHGNSDEALELSRRGKQEAKDSDEYYRFVVLDSKYFYYTMQADSFLKTHRQLEQYVRRQTRKNPAQKMLEIEVEMQKGVYLTKMVGQMDSALVHHFKALALTKNTPCSAGNRLVVLTNIADTYKQMGRYDKCIEYFVQALELGDSLVMSPATRITITVGIASAYSAMRSFEQSYLWWERAAQLRPEMTQTELFHYLNNRGNDLFLQENYSESLQYFLQIDSLLADNPDMAWERMFARCNLSAVYIKLGKTDLARPLLGQTEAFFTEQKQLIPLYYLTTQRIELALLDGHQAEALHIADQNPTPAWMIPEQVVLRQDILIKLFAQKKQWQRLAETLQSQKTLMKDIMGDNLKMRISEVMSHYEHERQLAEKRRQLEEKELSLRWTIAMLITSIVLIVLLVTISVQKHREMKLKQSVMESHIMGLRMETVRNRITPHFIGNALSAEMLAQAEGREVDLDSIVELLHRGFELTGKETSTLAEELEFIDFYCLIERRSIGPDFNYQAQIDDDVDVDHVLLPSMSIQILLENAIKHGLKCKRPEAGRQRTVTVRATRKGLATLVEVVDNGIGLPQDRKVNEHTGLKVLRQTITLLNRQNKEQVTHGLENVADGHGCRAWILLPDNYEYKLNTAEHQ